MLYSKGFTIRFCNTISIVATDCILHGRFFWADSGKENVKVCPDNTTHVDLDSVVAVCLFYIGNIH